MLKDEGALVVVHIIDGMPGLTQVQDKQGVAETKLRREVEWAWRVLSFVHIYAQKEKYYTTEIRQIPNAAVRAARIYLNSTNPIGARLVAHIRTLREVGMESR